MHITLITQFHAQEIITLTTEVKKFLMFFANRIEHNSMYTLQNFEKNKYKIARWNFKY